MANITATEIRAKLEAAMRADPMRRGTPREWADHIGCHGDTRISRELGKLVAANIAARGGRSGVAVWGLR